MGGVPGDEFCEPSVNVLRQLRQPLREQQLRTTMSYMGGSSEEVYNDEMIPSHVRNEPIYKKIKSPMAAT